MTLGVRPGVRRDAAVPTREEMRRQLLALVLAAVLVWYTFVVPAHAGSVGSGRPTPDDEGLEGEVRDAGGALPVAEGDPRALDELDWPEFIYP